MQNHLGPQIRTPHPERELAVVEHALACSLVFLLPLAAAEQAHAPLVRRLTHSQYNNTVRDLLGDQTRPADAFPQEDYVNGFKNQIASQDISPLLAETYHATALKLAKAAFQGGDDPRHLLPCKPKSATDSDCAVKFIRQVGQRAFRRPLTTPEVQRYSALLSKEAQRTGQFTDGAQLVIEAMLQSPKFLFRLEQDHNKKHKGPALFRPGPGTASWFQSQGRDPLIPGSGAARSAMRHGTLGRGPSCRSAYQLSTCAAADG